MNKLERWFVKDIIRKEVKQGFHERNVRALYTMIREACENEFAEDNEPTLNGFLSDCFESTQKDSFPSPKVEIVHQPIVNELNKLDFISGKK